MTDYQVKEQMLRDALGVIYKSVLMCDLEDLRKPAYDFLGKYQEQLRIMSFESLKDKEHTE